LVTVNVIVDDFARPFVDHVHIGRRYASPEVGAFEKVQRVTAFLAPYTPARTAHGRFENRRRVPKRRWLRRRRRSNIGRSFGRTTGRRRRRRRRRRGGSARRRRRVPSAATAGARGTQRTARTVFVSAVLFVVVVRIVVRVFLLLVVQLVVIVVVRVVVDALIADDNDAVVRRFQIIAPRSADSTRVRLRRSGNAQFFAVATVRSRRRRRRDHDDGGCVFQLGTHADYARTLTTNTQAHARYNTNNTSWSAP